MNKYHNLNKYFGGSLDKTRNKFIKKDIVKILFIFWKMTKLSQKHLIHFNLKF
jgi:hypothetical protein